MSAISARALCGLGGASKDTAGMQTQCRRLAKPSTRGPERVIAGCCLPRVDLTYDLLVTRIVFLGRYILHTYMRMCMRWVCILYTFVHMTQLLEVV